MISSLQDCAGQIAARACWENRSWRRLLGAGLVAGLVALWPSAQAQTSDLEALDRISVGMPRADARTLLGAPSQVGELDPGLISEIYRSEALGDGGLRATALLYDASGTLVGQQLIFEGAPGSTLAELLIERGYRTIEGAQADRSLRLSGYDDDTSRPQIVDIAEQPDYTVVTIFERRFHAEHAR